MKQIILLIFSIFSILISGNAQNSAQEEFSKNGEIYFQFEISSQQETEWFSKIISIDNFDKGIVTAYASKQEFNAFLKSGKQYKLLPHPNSNFNPEMVSVKDFKSVDIWDFYPTYDAYVAMMYQFEANYPGICDVFSIGQSVNGRELLVAKISDNINVDEDEPEFLYTSSIHGDETTGYILMLRLIDSLLTAYGTDPRITSLVNNMEIYINPLANPDGTYKGGNATVSGATRYNANNIDLNRNYPDPDDGPHPDGHAWQTETIHFMNFAETHNFVLSANMHGGTEVCNYPWDTWSYFCSDDNWWKFVCHEYADTAQAFSPSNYMNLYDDGITNGYAWYTISGGRQDYMNYYHQCREFTLEISDTKLLPASQLNALWEYNRRSFLNYMEQSLQGIRGIVTDATTGQPIKAEVYILNYEADSSWVYSNLPAGDYHRPVYAGTYDIRYSAPGYFADTIFNVTISNQSTIFQNVQLVPASLMADFAASTTNITPGGNVNFTNLSFGNPTSWEWTFEGGTPATSSLQNPSGIVYNSAGIYSVTLTVHKDSEINTLIKTNYITVADNYIMANTTVTACSGTFYDSGGNGSNYTNNEDFIMTFFPGAQNGKISVDFLEFDLEYQSSCSYDWLKIYDGPNTSSPILGTYCSTNSPGSVTSTHASGALTFSFHSDISVTRPGWKANLSCEILPIVLDLKVFIEGSFNGTNLNTFLNADNLIPLNQPYNMPPWNYSGTENVSTIPNPNVVDWVLLEIRDAANAASATALTSIAQQVAFLLNDGSIVGLDGISNPSFNHAIFQSLFVVIYHRNHLGIMSAQPLTASAGIYSYDFSSPADQAYGIEAQKNIGSNIFGMFSGDANSDAVIDDFDKSQTWNFETGLGGYLSSDLNLNGESDNQDKNDFWIPNYGQNSKIPD